MNNLLASNPYIIIVFNWSSIAIVPIAETIHIDLSLTQNTLFVLLTMYISYISKSSFRIFLPFALFFYFTFHYVCTKYTVSCIFKPSLMCLLIKYTLISIASLTWYLPGVSFLSSNFAEYICCNVLVILEKVF